MGKTIKRARVFERFTDFREPTRNKKIKTPLIYPDIIKLHQELMQAIDDGSLDSLTNILQNDFISPADAKDEITDFTGGNHNHYFILQAYTAENILDVLFFEHNELFYSLAQKLWATSNKAMNNCFIKCLAHSAIPPEMSSPWTDEEKQQIQLAVGALGSYEGHSGAKEESRKKHAHELMQQLNELLINIPQEPDDAVAWLNYKYDFIKTLHSKDAHFEEHLGWKRVITNVASLIFSAGILNFIHWLSTDNFFFYNQTTTQSLVSDISKWCASSLYAGYVGKQVFFGLEAKSSEEIPLLLTSSDEDTDFTPRGSS